MIKRVSHARWNRGLGLSDKFHGGLLLQGHNFSESQLYCEMEVNFTSSIIPSVIIHVTSEFVN